MPYLSRTWLLAGCGATLLCCCVCVCFGFGTAAAEIKKDVQLQAMSDEIARAKTLRLNDLDKPYFISYSAGDLDQLVVAGSLGGLNESSRLRMRSPQIEVRVGSYAFDNTNSIYSGRARIGLLPLDDDYLALRTIFWLASDALYKAATDQITRKRTALREMADVDKTPDLAPATALQLVLPPGALDIDQAHWSDEIRRLSGEFAKHPGVMSSEVRLLALSSTYRLVNSEGTVVRMPQELTNMDIRARGLASDGSPIWNHEFFTVLHPSELPSEDQIAHTVQSVAAQTDALEKAQLADEYSGPVLFEQEAAAQMMAEVMADASRLQRKPLSPPGSNARQTLEGVWSSRSGTKVAPDWMTILDDPERTSYAGKVLVGQYPADDEGVRASKVMLVEKGTLKGFLLSREPVRNFNLSNGHGRLPGAYGAQAAAIGNLFVTTDQPTPETEMKTKLIGRVSAAGLKYGILVRRLDFPSTANAEEVEGIAREMQKNGYVRTLTAPLLAWRVYPDGREELLRGTRFKEFSAKNLRDAVAASDRPYVLNYVNNGSTFNFTDARADETTSSVVCPSLLLEGVELDRAREELSKPPLVPPPSLTAQN